MDVEYVVEENNVSVDSAIRFFKLSAKLSFEETKMIQSQDDLFVIYKVDEKTS